MFTILLFAAGPSLGWFIFWILFAFIIGAFIGAQITSHEERALDYNLEDVELDELDRIEKYASAKGKAAIAKLKAAAARAKQLEQNVAGAVKKAL